MPRVLWFMFVIRMPDLVSFVKIFTILWLGRRIRSIVTNGFYEIKNIETTVLSIAEFLTRNKQKTKIVFLSL